MSYLAKLSPRSRHFWRLWKPIVATGAGGTAVAVWFEEILFFSEEILALVFFAIAGGLMNLFNLLIFKSTMPKREDFGNKNDKGEKK